MKDAETTWALVVGIDAYTHFKPLTGAARDAVAVVGWLRGLGVPDDQILLHAAPGPAVAAEVAALGLPVGDCTTAGIWTSFARLRKQQGRRLMVFLMGHAYHELTYGRLFLTQDSQPDDVANLSVEWYAALLRSLPFDRQFIVLDGCQNAPTTAAQRAAVGPGEHSTVLLGSPLPHVTQLLCASAGQGELALEDGDRGVFISELLAALDSSRLAKAATVDATTGLVRWNLETAVREIAGPATSKRAQANNRKQTPGVRRLDASAAADAEIVMEVMPAAVAALRLDVRPPAAAKDVKQLEISLRKVSWARVLDPPLSLPDESKLPDGLEVVVICDLVPDSHYAVPDPRRQVLKGNTEITVELTPPPAGARDAAPMVVDMLDPQGRRTPALTADTLELVRSKLARGGLALHADAIGFRAHQIDPSRRRLWHRDVLDVVDTINRRTPPEVTAVSRGTGPRSARTTLRFRVTTEEARRLAGHLADEPVVDIDGTSYSLLQLARLKPLKIDPAPLTVRIVLPWGTWSRDVDPRPGRQSVLRAPARIGVPPLRVQLWHRLTRTDYAPRTVVDATSGNRLDVATGPQSAERWRALGAAPGRLHFPLSEYGAVAVLGGRQPRAEPLSKVTSSVWDALVASGDLAALSAEDAVELARAKWFSPVLGLAGAYACFAHSQDAAVREALTNLRRLDPDLPDLVILDAALDARTGVRRRRVARALPHAGVPLFRWGVALGVFGAVHYEADALATTLREIDATLIQGSVWTVWRP